MTARNAMLHRCTIQRDASHEGTNEDEWGNDQPPAWSDHLTNVSCRYWYDNSATVQDGEKRILSTARYLLLPIETDVINADRISIITDRRGRTLAPGPMRIDTIGPHEFDHICCELVAIT